MKRSPDRSSAALYADDALDVRFDSAAGPAAHAHARYAGGRGGPATHAPGLPAAVYQRQTRLKLNAYSSPLHRARVRDANHPQITPVDTRGHCSLPNGATKSKTLTTAFKLCTLGGIEQTPAHPRD